MAHRTQDNNLLGMSFVSAAEAASPGFFASTLRTFGPRNRRGLRPLNRGPHAKNLSKLRTPKGPKQPTDLNGWDES